VEHIRDNVNIVCRVRDVCVLGQRPSAPSVERARGRASARHPATIDRMKIDEVPSLARKARIAAHTHIKVRRARRRRRGRIE